MSHTGVPEASGATASTAAANRRTVAVSVGSPSGSTSTPSTLLAIRAGYRPVLHPDIEENPHFLILVAAGSLRRPSPVRTSMGSLSQED
jgi:hypothetical protein